MRSMAHPVPRPWTMFRSGELSFLRSAPMFSRPMLFLGVLVAAVVVPYVLLDEHLPQTVRGPWSSVLGKADEERETFLDRFNPAPYSPAPGPRPGPRVV